MRTLMSSLYDNLDGTKAFALGFTNFVHTYDDTCYFDFAEAPCPVCDRAKQNREMIRASFITISPRRCWTKCMISMSPSSRFTMLLLL